jgi:CRP/FNR family transcriptional regulator
MGTALAVSQAKYWHLRQMGVFKSLSDWELKQLVKFADLRLIKTGTEVYRDGDLAHHFYVIRSGKVKLYRDLLGGKRMILDFHGVGDVFGEGAVLGETTRGENAEVVDDAFVCVIDRDQFSSYLGAHPDVALQFSAVIARRRRRAESSVAALLSQDVRTRLAHTLVRLATEHGQQDERGMRVDLRLTQTDLGQLVGSTRETTSMAFNAFKRAGLVEAKDRVLWVLDPATLSSY